MNGMPLGRALLYLATAGVLGVAVHSLAVTPLPVWAALSLALAYAALVTTGVLVLQLRMFVDAVVRGPEGAQGLVLTFDDGPDPETTPRVLDALDAAGVKATFFVIARKVEAAPDLTRSIVARGHAVGLHSYAHDRLFSLRSAKVVRADLERGVEVLTRVLGARPHLFRPPIGHTNPTIARVASDLRLTLVGWSLSARDGLSASASVVADRVKRRLAHGAIVLLHDAAERGGHLPAAPLALPPILAEAERRRIPVVPLALWTPAPPPVLPVGFAETL